MPGGEIWKQFLLKSSLPDYNISGETIVIADNWDQFFNIARHDVLVSGTHAQMAPSLMTHELAMGRWYRSKEKMQGKYPFGGYLSNKNWHLNEVKYPNNYFVHIFDI